METQIKATNEVVLTLKETMEKLGRSSLKTVPVEAKMVIVGSWTKK